MCDCFHLAFPNWHAASSGTGAGRRLRGPEPGTEDDSICDEQAQFTEGERPRPQGSSPVEEYPETEKYSDSDRECEVEHDPHHKSGSGKKTKKSGLGSMFEKRSTPKMSKLKEVPSPESGVIVKTAKDGCAEGLIYGGGGKEGIFIKEVVPESPASKSLKLKEGDQVLSATVYFDNVSYEDAIQILEHAQAYKVKLCLKRKPEITETEPTIESDVIPEEDVYAPEMKVQEKTKRRGDARISWPKFPSFGKGRKSRFRRSHSSSEADEQRKLELSPTTSDTESPIKSQDALKGKKKHKIKLSALTKRGRISSSEDQDTDAPTSGQISGNILQTHEASDMLSPECLESPSRETPEVYVTEDLKVVEDLRTDQNDQNLAEPQTAQHKVELITITGSTLKTEDLTVALAGQESPSVVKSPDGKKKKKEKSELKMKILGKDKHKKDAKAKSSPKRLKTLGASIEIADQPENEKSGVIPSFESPTQLDASAQIISSKSSKVISAKPVTTQMEMSAPKVELDISDAAFVRKSPKKGEEKTKKGKDKHKQETKTSPAFKLPKVGFGEIATEETIQKMNVNVEECTAKIEQLTTEGTQVKEDPYERLSKGSLSRMKLPKREDIEIPGMEDMSMTTKAKGIKELGHHEEIQAETVQLSIDVDSVKEAVSKLPGFKLPKVDNSGVPIPEEITVIDANAQRISVKTPTKVVDAKAKHEAHFTKFDITASPEISKTTVKLPKIPPADLTSEKHLIETKADLKKSEKKYKTKAKQSDKEIKTEVYKREHIIIPGKESAQEEAIFQAQATEKTQDTEESDKKSRKAKIKTPSFGIAKPDIKIPDIGIELPKQNTAEQKSANVKGERTIFHQEVNTSKTETRGQIVGVTPDVKIPEIDGIEYIDSVDGSAAKKDGDIRLTGFDVNLDATKPNADISFPEIRGEVKDVEAEEHTVKLPTFGVVTPDISVHVPDADKDINIDGAEIKTQKEGKGSKFKMPNLSISMPKVKGPKIDLSLSKKDEDLTLPKGEGKLTEVPEVDITLRNVDVSIQEQRMEVDKPESEIKPLQTDGELHGEGGKFKMPKIGIKMPKIKGPEFDLSLSKKDGDALLPDAKAEGKLSEVPEIDVTLGNVDVSIPEQKMEVKKPELEIKSLQTESELDGQGGKFKMPKFGIKMPKIQGPEFDLSVSKKDRDATLPDVKAEGKLPKEIDVTLGNVNVSIPEQKKEVKKPELGIKPLQTDDGELDGQGSKLKMPKLGIAMPKVKGPDMDFNLSKKDIDVTIPGAKAEVKLPDVELEEPSSKVEIKAPEIKGAKKDAEGSPSKFKMPTFKLPKFGGASPNVNVEISNKTKAIEIPETQPKPPKEGVTVDITAPSFDIEGPSLDVQTTAAELDGKGSKFKMPKFGISLPKVKGSEMDLSLSKKDVDVTLAEVKLPGAPKVDVNLGKADVSLPEEKLEVKKPEFEMQSEVEFDGQGGKFKMPKLGMSMPKVKGPEIHFGLSKKDVDVTLPEASAEVKVPEAPTVGVSLGKADISFPEETLEVKKPELGMQSEVELDGQGGKFKMPKFGMSMPKVKGPEIDLSLSKKDIDVTLPEAQAEVKVPDIELKEPSAKVEIKAPEIKVAAKGTEGSPSKFKMPTFKLPKFGGASPNVNVEISNKTKAIELPETQPKPPKEGVTVDITAPSVDIEGPSLDVKTTAAELDGKGSKFKMPKFGISLPKVKGSEMDLSLSKKDVDVTLAEVKLPEAPKVDVNLGKADVSLPEEKLEVKKPEFEMQGEVELDGQGGKFKMPKLGMSMPKVKGPEIHFGLSKKDVDVTLPEASAEVKVPEAPTVGVSLGKADVSFPEEKLEVKKSEFEMQSEVELDGQGGKFKMPKLGMSMPKVKGPEIHFGLSKKDVDVTLPEASAEVKVPEAPKVDVSLGKADVSFPEETLEVKKPELGMQSEVELDGQGGKFKMPKFGMSMPKVKGPEIDLSLSKKDIDVTLPEAQAEVKVPDIELKEPSAKVEIKAPEIKVAAKGTEGSPSKFKMPTFKLPKFGLGTPTVSVEVPDMDKHVKIDGADINIPEERSAVNIEAPSIDIEGPSVDMKTTGTEQDGKGSKFKMPHLSFSMPKVKGPKMDLSLSKKDSDVTLPEARADVKLPEVDLGKADFSIPEAKMEVQVAKAEVKLPEAPKIAVEMKQPGFEVEMDGHDGKFKMPKFGIEMPKVKGPDIDLSLSKKDVDVTLPQTKVEVKLPDAPKIDARLGKTEVLIPGAKAEVEKPELEIAAAEHEGQGSKFKMPKFGMSMPKVKGPEFHPGLSKKDVDVTLPEAKADVNLPDVELKEPSAKVEMKAPEIEVVAKDTEGSLFSMPKVKGPEIDLSLPKKDTDITLPGTEAEVKLPRAPKVYASLGKAEVLIPEAEVEVKKPEVEIKSLQTDTELEGQRGKFKMPKFGITMPKVKGPQIDLNFSKKDADVTLPETKAEVKLPEAPKMDIKLGQVDVSIPETKMEVKKPQVEIKPLQSEGELDGQGRKYKMPKFGMSMPKVKGPEIDFSLSKKDADITLPEAKAEVNLPDVELKEPSAEVEIKAPEIEAQLSSGKGSPSKFKLPTFKFPKFGVASPNVSAEAPNIDKEIKTDGADVHISVPHTGADVPKVKAEVHLPEIKVNEPSSVEADAKLKKPRFSLPRFSFTKPSVKAPEVDVSLPDVNVAIPQGKVEVKGGEVDKKTPECEAEVAGQGSKFKMPEFGITMPKVTGPEIDLGVSKKDVDVTLPEAKAEDKLPDAELKFGVGMPSATIEVPDMYRDSKIDGADIKIPEEVLSVDIATPSIDMEGPAIDMKTTGTEHEGKGSKFEMPKFGITMPKVTGPEIDLSLSKKDVDVTLPHAKAEVKVPDVELKKPSAEVEIKAPEIKAATKDTEGSPSKFKMPTFKLPKFGVGMPRATVEVSDKYKDGKVDGADIKIPEEVLTVEIAAPSIDTEGPSIDIKTTRAEHEGKGSKFKMPKFGITMPKVTGPEIDLSVSKKDVDVTLPGAKAEVKVPEAELKKPSAEVEIKAPAIEAGISLPKVQRPKTDVGLLKKDVDVKLPKAKTEVTLPEASKVDVSLGKTDVSLPEEKMEVKMPELEMKSDVELDGQGGKFKMPKFGMSMPKVKGPEIDLSLSKKDVDVTLPEAKAEVKVPDIELKKPSAEVEIKAPEIKVATKDTKGSPSRFKMPTFKLPKFGVGMPSATIEEPDTHKDVKIDGADIKIPEKVPTVDVAAPSIDMEGPSIDMKTTGTEHEGKGSKFKMPKFGITMPKVTGPEIDLSLSKKDVDVTLPETKAEVKVPEVELKKPSAEVEIKAPEIKVVTKDTEESPSKFKMPTFKLPKFGVGMPSATVEVPDTHKDGKVDGVDIKIPEEVLTVEIAAPNIDTEGPSIDMKTIGTEHEGKGSKFNMPKFGITMPKVTGPEIDLSLSKKDVDVTLPETKAEVKVPDVELKKPSAEVEIKAPEISVTTKDTEESPSKFKMPTFKLPKFGVGMPSATIDVPGKDGKVDGADIKIPEGVLTVDIAAPSIDMEGPSVDIKTTGTEHEGKGSKFKMPKFGITMPKVTGPEIDLSASKKDVDLTLPETKAEVNLPEVELKKPSAEVEITAPGIDVHTSNVEGSPSKFKMPTFKLPKFGAATPDVNVEVPDVDKQVKVAGAKLPDTKVEGTLPDVKMKGPVGSISVSQAAMTEGDAKLKKTRFSLPKFSFSKQSPKEREADGSLPEVDISLPNVEVKQPEVEFKPPEGGVELDGHESKFKMPKFGISMPKVKGPEIDLSLSKKDVDVTLPEAKAEVQLPDVKIKQPSAKVEIKGPEIEAQAGKVEGSPSKLKMPTFTLPKFGGVTPKVDVEVPEEGATVEVTAPSIETEGLSVDVTSKGSELEGSGSKFKMPKFGISMPKVKGPEIDLSLSKKDVDVTPPEAKAEVQLPDVKIKQPSAKVEIKGPEIEAQGGKVEGSPSKLKMPTFTLPKFSGVTSKVDVEVPDVDKDIKIDGAKLGVSKEGATVDVTAPSIDTDLSVDVKAKGSELEGSGSKFKMPKFGISMPKVKGPEIDLSLSKKDVDVTLPEAKAEVQLPDVKIKQPSAKVEIKGPEIEAQAGKVEGSPSKLKMPTFTLPKFGAVTPKVDVEVPDVDKDIKIDRAKLGVSQEGTTVDVTVPSIDTDLSVDVKAKGSELEGSGSKFKMPKFGMSMPKVKGPEIDLSLSKKDVDVTLPEAKAEVKLPDVEVKEPEGAISVPDAPKVEVEAKSKRPIWTFPKFSFSRTGGKAPDLDVNLETPKADVTSPEAKAEVSLPNVEVQGPSGAISMEEPPAAELDANLKKTKFSLPRFSFSKSSVKEPEVSAELPHVDVSLPEGEVIVKQPEMEIKAPELEAERTGQESKFILPKFGIALPKTKGTEADLNASRKDVDITLPEVKAEVKLPEIGVKESSAGVEIKASEIEAKSKDTGGSPSKFKMPTVKMPKFGGATYDVTVEAPDADKVVETSGDKLKEDVTVNIKGQSVDIKTNVSEAAITESETPKTETDSAGLGSPSKFKLPSFKMPRLSFSRSKPEDEYVPVETECKEDRLEMEAEPKGESKSPKMTLTSFGEILKNIDVEFDVPKTDNVEEHLETSKDVHKTNEPSGKQEGKEKETSTKQDATKSPERTGWFKFPKFGLSSPSEPAKIPEKDKDEKSPAGETVDEEISPTCSVQSSDAFADISSAMTSEHVGLSLSSPTKVTVKYSDPSVAGHGDMHSNIITSTTRTELISVEPNLPEKITILASGVSSSSEDTLRLESGKIHVITSNIQATPEAQHAKVLTAVQVQSAGGLPLQSEANEAASWTVEDSQSGKRTVFERHLVRETSSEISESKDTIVITKQITRMLDSSEPISGETASSLQRLKDSVHSEKMRFFDGAEK